MSRTTFEARVAELFERHPDEWIDCARLMAVGGQMAWRTRVSDCRKRGMRIENRLLKRDDGSTISQYRYVRPVATHQPSLLEAGL